jgi:type III secretory pathway component EscT
VLPTPPQGEFAVLMIGALLSKKAIIGAVLGFVSSFLFDAAEGVGFIFDVQRGSSMTTIFDPVAGSPTSLMGNLLIQMMSVAFFSICGFLFFWT